MISHFDVRKLSKEGFRVLVDEMDVKLPSGEVIANGMNFRNTYHLRARQRRLCLVVVDLRLLIFRMSAVLSSMAKSKIPYIVEGANLYILYSI